MKKLFVLFMALALIGSASACWGLACTENPYRFNNPDFGADGWGTWGGGSAVVANGVCTLTTDTYQIMFIYDNGLADIGNPVPGVDNVEIIIKVVDIVGSAIIKIESYDAANSFPNNDDGTGSLRIDAWDPATKITGPGVYRFSTAEKGGPIPVDTVAVTPIFGVSGLRAELVVDWIWIGKEGTFPYDPCPYEIAGDADGDCRVTLNDLALMLANWLIDCIDDPANPACITP